MENQRIVYLLEQHLAATATTTEQNELKSFLREDTQRELATTTLAALLQQEVPVYPANTEVWQKMLQDILALDRAVPAPTRAKRIPLYRWAAAAAVLLIISTVVYMLLQPAVMKATTVTALAIQPVEKSALILSDGRKIEFDEASNGVIFKEGTTTITKHKKQLSYTNTGTGKLPDHHMIAISRGKEYEVVLSDGSHVWLNAASAIRFPVAFSGNKREIELAGQAWFSVSHAGNSRFRVQTGSFTTTVLGTAFEIKAYPDDNYQVIAVQRGKVQVQAPNNQTDTLEAGQQLTVRADTIIQPRKIDTTQIGEWVYGDIAFEDEPIESVVRHLQRVYKDSIVIKNQKMKGTRITGMFNKKTGLKEILNTFCAIFYCQITRKNGVYIIE